jgi:hypothetical protein
VEVVGKSGADVGGYTDDHVPRVLGAIVDRGGNTHFVAGEDSADIYLVGGELIQLEVTVAPHNVPLLAEVMINAGNVEVAALRSQQVGLVADGVDAIAERGGERTATGVEYTTCVGVSLLRQLLGPELLDRGIHADSAWVGGFQLRSGIGVATKGQIAGHQLFCQVFPPMLLSR